MRFMKTEAEGDISLEGGKLTEKEAEDWKKEYLSSEGKEPSDTLTEEWADEYTAPEVGSKVSSEIVVINY